VAGTCSTSTRKTNQKTAALGYVYNEELMDAILGEEVAAKKGRNPRDSDSEDFFTVEKIIDKKKEGKKLFYLVKWEGYPEEQNTWEPVANLSNVKDLVKEFEKKNELSTSLNQASTSLSIGEDQKSKKQELSLNSKVIKKKIIAPKSPQKEGKRRQKAEPESEI